MIDIISLHKHKIYHTLLKKSMAICEWAAL